MAGAIKYRLALEKNGKEIERIEGNCLEELLDKGDKIICSEKEKV